ncbi:signal peptidase II [uncultured Draconibacterium sp.]|uniref:signal peptidase II n=1 Tax=uncultured Draconibacterium sp. TaxID=1573823 RepID=UPI002AA90003|nr:signal peptidase II [uncultured Draconibacterium sp.]
MKKTIIKYLILISFMISGCSADLKTKEIAKTNLKEHSTVLIENAFDLRYVENHSVAFGFLGSIKKSIRLPLIFLLTISASMFAFVMIWKMKNKQFRLLLPFFILIGGAYGNILDRIFNGFVTDFFHVHYFYEYNFPVFNVADILVNIAVFLIIIQWKDFKPIFENMLGENPEPLIK